MNAREQGSLQPAPARRQARSCGVPGDAIRSAAARWTPALLLLLAMADVARAQVDDLPEPLSLIDVVARARSRHPEVAAMDQRAAAAALRPAIVAMPDDPRVFLSADHVPLTMPGIDLSASAEFGAPLGRVLHHRRRAASATAEGRREEVAQAALEVQLEAAMAFYRLRYARSIGALLASQRALAAQLVAAATARYGAGLGSQGEVLRAQTEVARIDATIRSVDGMLISAEGMLNAAMGRPAGGAIPTLADAEPSSPVTLESALDEARDARPELRAGARYVDAAGAEIDVMRGMYRPMVMARVGGAHTMLQGPGLMGMLGFSVPIFRGRLRAGVGEARAMRAMAERELDAARLEVEAEVASAFGDLASASARARGLRDEVVPLARRSVEAMLAEYGAGRVPLVGPIEATRALFGVEAERLMSDMEVGMATARLLRAVGRFEEATP